MILFFQTSSAEEEEEDDDDDEGEAITSGVVSSPADEGAIFGRNRNRAAHHYTRLGQNYDVFNG